MRRARVVAVSVVVAALGAAAWAADAPEPAASQRQGFDLKASQLQCAQGSLDVDALLRQTALDKTLDRALFGGKAAASREVDDYLLCRSLPGGRDPLCANVAAREKFCADEAAFMRFIWAAFQGKDAAARCRDVLPPDARSGSERLCALLTKAVRDGGDPRSVCAEGRAAGLPAALAGGCPKDLAFIAGDPGRCVPGGDGAAFERCRRRATLVAALRGGPGGCQRSALCAAMEGGAAACEPLRQQAVLGACRQLGAYIVLEKDASGPKGYTEKDRKARDRVEVARETKKKRAEDAAANGAALKQAALEKVKRADEQRRQREAKNFKRTFKDGQPMQDVPPDVQKQMDDIEKKGRRDEAKESPNEDR